MEKIVITGMGIVSCLGLTLDQVSRSLREGISGIVLDSSRKAIGFRSGLTGHIPSFDLSSYGFTRKQMKSMGESALYASAAAFDALKDAGLQIRDLSENTGLVVGNDSCVKNSYEAVSTVLQEKNTQATGSGAIFKCMNSTVTMNLSTLFGIKGYNITLSGACASGAHALGHALHLLRMGLLDRVIAGGAQEINWEVYSAFDGLSAFSIREDSPAEASRPFDAGRDGLVPSGGSAMLILERESLAKERRASRIYGELAGYGFSSDGTYLSMPSGEGGVRAMKMALKDAAVEVSSIDYVNAHATSTPEGDRMEAFMISEVLGSEVAVSSTKSLTGHECWMAGASEAVYSLLMMRDGFIAGNLNFEKQDEIARKIHVIGKSVSANLKTVMSNSFGFGGTNAVLIFKKY